jgi:hypothetical protein
VLHSKEVLEVRYYALQQRLAVCLYQSFCGNQRLRSRCSLLLVLHQLAHPPEQVIRAADSSLHDTSPNTLQAPFSERLPIVAVIDM